MFCVVVVFTKLLWSFHPLAASQVVHCELLVGKVEYCCKLDFINIKKLATLQVLLNDLVVLDYCSSN